MTFTKLAQILLITGAIMWLFNWGGRAEHGRQLALLSGGIGALAMTITHIKAVRSARTLGLIVTATNALMMAIVGGFASSQPLLWLALVAINAPVYLYIASLMFDSQSAFFLSVTEMLSGDNGSSIAQAWAGHKGLVFFAACVLIVIAEYRLVAVLWPVAS